MKVMLTEPERDELARLVQHALSDTRVEARRTRKPGWQSELHREADLLTGLLDKLGADVDSVH